MLQWRADPIQRDIVLFLGDLTGPAFSSQFALLAGEQIEEAKQINFRALNREPPFETFVDGKLGAPLDSVRPNGVIFTEFHLTVEVLAFITDQLQLHSPVKSGRYKKNHNLFADGTEIDPHTQLLAQLLAAQEFVFVNSVPYARKIERGLSQQAPDGVYQAVALLARRQYGKIARISFTYRTVLGGVGGHRSLRNPAIVVRLI